MTSRERVLAAIRHTEADRVPVDVGGMNCTSIMIIAHNRLKQYLGRTDEPTRMSDWGQQVAEPESWVLERFGADVISVGRITSPVTDLERTREFDEKFGGGEWKTWILPDGSTCLSPSSFDPEPDGKGGWQVRNDRGVFAVMPKGALYFDSAGPANHALYDVTSVEDLGDWRPSYSTEEGLVRQAEKARWLHENTDFAIMGGFGGSIHEQAQGLREWGQWMIDMAGEPELARELVGRMAEAHSHNGKLYMEMVGPYIDILVTGDDLGIQAGPQMSPAMYHDVIHPGHKAVYQTAKRVRPDIPIFLHSCGGIRPLIPDLIDEGVDILNPVQTNAVGMEPAGLKRDFGDAVTFWGGGAEVAGALTTGTPSEVREQVRERIRTLAPGGGYVFNQVHNIQANVPPENIVAMFDAAYEFGSYPIA